MRLTSLPAVVLVAAACGSSRATSVSPPSNRVACARGAITLGAAVNGTLDSASTCTRRVGLNRDSTLTASYSLSVQSGHGYLVTMAGQHLHGVMALTSPGGDTLRAASPTYSGPTPQARLLIASQVTETDSVHATTFDTLASDTGAFSISAQSCKVPVAPLTANTDSMTHADTVGSGDCQVSIADFLDESHSGQVSVHLYALHFSSGTYRQVTIDASSPVWLFMGGPKDDTFGALPGDGIETIDSATTNTTNEFGLGEGDYTLVVAAPAPTSYTLTVGAGHPFTRFSRSRSRPLAGRRRSTPPSPARRGR